MPRPYDAQDTTAGSSSSPPPQVKFHSRPRYDWPQQSQDGSKAQADSGSLSSGPQKEVQSTHSSELPGIYDSRPRFVNGAHGAAASGSSARATGVVPASVWEDIQRAKLIPDDQKVSMMRDVMFRGLVPRPRKKRQTLPSVSECVRFIGDHGTDEARKRIDELNQSAEGPGIFECIPVECIATCMELHATAQSSPGDVSLNLDRCRLLSLFEFGHPVMKNLSLLDTLNNSDLWDYCKQSLHSCLF